MTTYVTIPNSDIDQDSPVTQPLMTALRDNLVAVSEGDATAPSILPNIAAKATAGGVGTYVFARTPNPGTTDVAFGSTIAGSGLVPTSAITEVDDPNVGITMVVGSALSGTWRAMGYYDARSGTTDAWGATLFLRIS